MTAVVYSALALSFAARILADLDDTSGRAKRTGAGETVDGMPFVGIVLLFIGWAACREDPLGALGLSISSLARCPWGHMLAVWVVAFTANRAAQAYLFRSELRGLADSGTINPGGAYLALVGSGHVRSAVVGAAMTFSQTFIEEFFFRGLAPLAVVRALERPGISTQVAFAVSAVASSLAFGLIHFLPMKRASSGASPWLAWYALVMPSGLGVCFCILNAMAGSLWPGWLVHWGLNYVGFMWSRTDPRWGRPKAPSMAP
ncbi:MAG: lysostaphin resistance A-like protein [Bacillota bacterium]